MICFLIKKWFWTLWDNMLPLIGINLLFLILTALGLAPLLLTGESSPFILIPSLLFTLLLLAGAVGTAGRFLRDINDNHTPEWRSRFLRYFKESFRSSLLLALITITALYTLFIALRFYSRIPHPLAFTAMVLIFWVMLLTLLMVNYTVAVLNRLNSELPKIIKKSFLLVVDNPLKTLLAGIGSTLLLILACTPLTLILGVGSLILWQDAALKILLHKYDYLEKNPEVGRRNIPWKTILFEENELIGKRTLKGMIFPWKE